MPNARSYPSGPILRRAVGGGCALLLVLSLGAHALAQSEQPHELVNVVISRVLERLDGHITDDAAVRAEMLELFEQELSPHVAFETIARWIAGKRWEVFSEAERVEMMAAVHDHVVQVYASLLARGRGVEISIDSYSTVLTRSAKVGGLIATADGRDFILEFRLLRQGEEWKLYDLAVDGLSFARSLHAELRPVINEGGIPGLRKYMTAHQ